MINYYHHFLQIYRIDNRCSQNSILIFKKNPHAPFKWKKINPIPDPILWIRLLYAAELTMSQIHFLISTLIPVIYMYTFLIRSSRSYVIHIKIIFSYSMLFCWYKGWTRHTYALECFIFLRCFVNYYVFDLSEYM